MMIGPLPEAFGTSAAGQDEARGDRERQGQEGSQPSGHVHLHEFELA